MDEPEAPPPHAGERLTREDILRLRAERGGPRRLDLRKADLHQADLSDLDLHGANLDDANLEEANLTRVNLRGASLFRSNLQQAFLLGGHLEGASIVGANLQRAYLTAANLDRAYALGADLRRANLTLASLRQTDLEDVKWGDYKLDEEVGGGFADAASVYRGLKQRHTETGIYDIAGEFHYREMEARRKLAWKERRLPYAVAMNALRFVYGYGERPERVIGWAGAIIFGLALIHWVFGTVAGGFLEALYFSAVSFTALGYGWAAEPQRWAGRFLGVGEAMMGVFMMALFLVTFTRKMTR